MIKKIFIFALLSFSLVPAFDLTFGIEPLDRVVINDERLVNLSGTTLGKNILVNQQVQITAKITNTQDDNQDFIYLVQVKDENDVVVKLGWISGSLTDYQSFSPSLSWTPKESGVYTAEIFVWDTLQYQDALTPPVIVEIITS